MNFIKMDFTNMTIKAFIDYIITFDNVQDILYTCKTPQDKVGILNVQRCKKKVYFFVQRCKKKSI